MVARCMDASRREHTIQLVDEPAPQRVRAVREGALSCDELGLALGRLDIE